MIRLALVVVAAGLLAAPGSAYRIEGQPWPKGVVPYYSFAAGHAWSLKQAVDAWNGSGARVRFVAVAPARAKLFIREAPKNICTHAAATVGHTSGATVFIWPAGRSSPSCNRYTAARALTHELGHVLGLSHESRTCALMNPSGSHQATSQCGASERWEWRCRLVERDDVGGAAALYGGTVRPTRTPAFCSLYAPIAAPTATVQAEGTSVRVAVKRPPSPQMPSFLAGTGGEEAFVVAEGKACVSSLDLGDARVYRWRGATTEITRPRAGCYSIWAIDRLGRPSASPAVARLP
jgi:hypothetical protein